MDFPIGIGAYDFGYGVTAFDFNNDTIKDIYWIGSEVGRGEGPGGNVYPSAGRMLKGKSDFSYEDITIRLRLLDIQGINYYIDTVGNVYKPEDIIQNKDSPQIIAKWERDVNDNYIIPEFN